MQVVTWIFWAAWALIIYTYFAFPLILSLIARLRTRDSASSSPTGLSSDYPTVSIVVAAYNEAHIIERKLANCWALEYPEDRLEILIGSDGSDDGTNEALEQCGNSRLRSFLFEERRGKISVLNTLMEQVDSDIVVMSDANTMLAPDAIRKLVARFIDPNVGCVSGELQLEQEGGVSGEGLYWKYEGWIKRNESRLGFLIGCNGGIFSIRRHLYEPLPASTIVEDFVLSMRILEKGYKVEFEPEAKATEPACVSTRAEMIRKIRIGAGGFQSLSLTKKLLHPRFGMTSFAFWGHKVLRWFVPVMLLVAIVSNALLISNSFYPVCLLAQVVGAALGYLAYVARPGRSMPRLVRPISYFYLMNFALFCGLLRFLSGTQRVTWERTAPTPETMLASHKDLVIPHHPTVENAG